MSLWLIRHAQTAWNAQGLAQGHTEVPLDEMGLYQARALCYKLARTPPRPIVSSDLGRALQTFEGLVRLGWQAEAWPELRERSLGEWEGRPIAEVHYRLRAAPEAGRLEAAPPGGESLADVWGRACAAVERLAGMDGPVVAVSHGMMLGLLLARLLGGGIEMYRSFKFDNCGVTELTRLGDGRWRLARYNDVSHLGGA